VSAQAADSPAAPRALGLAVVVFAATVIVAVGAFLITQRVKHLPTPIARFEVGPIVKVPGGRERIAVQLASPDTVEMTIVDGGGRTVATVARGIPLSPAQTLVVRWDGREGSNSLALISGGKVVRVHPIRHDRTKEHGAFATPNGRPRKARPA